MAAIHSDEFKRDAVRIALCRDPPVVQCVGFNLKYVEANNGI